MVEVENPITYSEFLRTVRERPSSGFKFNSPQEFSLEMQRAAFGEVRKVTKDEYEELTNTVRDIREWLIENGVSGDETVDGVLLPIDFINDNYGSFKAASISHEHSKPTKPYSKFSFEFVEGEDFLGFDLNSDETYNLFVDTVEGETEPFTILQWPLTNMTKAEHDFVMGCIGKVASHFEIPLR